MPTLLLLNGIRYFFFSNENNEPIHVHIAKGSAHGKIWLEPSIKLANWKGFNSAEQKEILENVKANYETFKLKWNEYFGQ